MDTASKRHSSCGNGGIDKLADDILINILSRLSTMEASRASVLAPRWRYLWRSSHGILRFDTRDTVTGAPMGRLQFNSYVKTALQLHQAPEVEGVVVSFDSGRDTSLIRSNRFRHADEIKYTRSHAIAKCVTFASRKKVERLELSFSLRDGYKFPTVKSLVSLSDHGATSTSPLCCLRTLRLAYVDVEDEVVHYFLASCPSLEELRVRYSYVTKNPRVIDPPGLKVLEISRCFNIQSLEISAADLVSLTYGGGEKSLVLKKIPNLRELNICDKFWRDFLLKPNEHLSYSVQLEKLALDFRLLYDYEVRVSKDPLGLDSLKRLEVQVPASRGGVDLVVVATLMKQSPQLREFRIEMFHSVKKDGPKASRCVQPMHRNRAMRCVRKATGGIINHRSKFTGKFNHENLKVVEVHGYIGCEDDDELVKALIETGRPRLERVAIDTESDYYDSPELKSLIAVDEDCWSRPDIGAMTRDEAKERAGKLLSDFSGQIKFTSVT